MVMETGPDPGGFLDSESLGGAELVGSVVVPFVVLVLVSATSSLARSVMVLSMADPWLF